MSQGDAQLVVVVLIVVIIKCDSVLLRYRGVLIVLRRLPRTNAAEAQVKRSWTGLLQFARFFEATMTTLLHGRAPNLE